MADASPQPSGYIHLGDGPSSDVQPAQVRKSCDVLDRRALWTRVTLVASCLLGVSLLLVTLAPSEGPGLRSGAASPSDELAPLSLEAMTSEPRSPDADRPPPVFHITASSPYEAGLQHGRLAGERIRGWMASPEMQKLAAWVATPSGKQALEQLKKDNTDAYPEYVEEMHGVAHGAGISVDQVWCANMLNELEAVMTRERDPLGHCSDIFAISPGGYGEGFIHGHNDDWSSAVMPFWYVLSYENVPGFADCAGIAYPAASVGWAPTWNPHGIFFTQNSLSPVRTRAWGLANAFAQRRAVCGAKSMDEVMKRMSVPGWSEGAAMNVLDIKGRRMANIEVWEDISSVQEITGAMGNYSHFNQYKHLQKPDGSPIDDPSIFVTDHRQAEVDRHLAPRSADDVRARLSDQWVFRPDARVTSLLVDGLTGDMQLWCCGVRPSGRPAYRWNMFEFFGAR